MRLTRTILKCSTTVCCTAFFAATAPVFSETPKREAITLSLPQAQALAEHALRGKEPRIAVQFAKGLLLADPKSSDAHFILARAYAQQAQQRLAQRFAAKAFRYADHRAQKFRAAEFSARLAYAANKPTAAQLWLRRAAQNARNEQVEQQLGSDYARLRIENPLSFSIRGAFKPSNNVNNGADTAVQIIDGLPVTGTLSGSAQALSGIVGNLDGKLSYRLRSTAKNRTQISARLFVQRVNLSRAAKALSPISTNSDFGATHASVSLQHSFSVGENAGRAQISGTTGQFWSGQSKSYDFGRLDAARTWVLSPQNTLNLAASLENRQRDNSLNADTTLFRLSAAVSHVRPTGDKLRFSMNLLKSNSSSVNSDYASKSIRAGYTFAKELGPAQVTAGLTIGETSYDSYYAAPVFVTTGRQDQSAYADLNLFFADLDYAGFAPTINIRVGRKSSNISRFDTRELSVSLGIRSKF